MDKEDLRAIHEHQFQLTVFADAKAGALLVLFSGILGALLASHREEVIGGVARLTYWPDVLPCAAAVLLLLSVGCLAAALRPRGPRALSHPNLLYFRYIASRPNAAAFADEITAVADDDALMEWGKNIYSLSQIARAKLGLVGVGFWLGLAGACATLAAVGLVPQSEAGLQLQIHS